MCGILCIVPLCKCKCQPESNILEDQVQLLHNRGPDASSTHLLENGIYLAGYVLWQQGFELTLQPVITEQIALLFNGDIFNSNKSEALSDTQWLTQTLSECQTENDILKVFKQIKGPYSIIFYCLKTETLYFGRDSLGRNSLLIEKDDHFLRIVSSSAQMNEAIATIELPPVGLFSFNYTLSDNLRLIPWQKLDDAQNTLLENLELSLSMKINIVDQLIEPEWILVAENDEPLFDFFEIIENNEEPNYASLLKKENVLNATQTLLNLIENSVLDRIKSTPKYCASCMKEFLITNDVLINCCHAKVGILFSGGIDCTILAALVDQYVEDTDPIDLINVAFEGNKSLGSKDEFNVPDRISARESMDELRNLFPSRIWNLIEVNVTRNELSYQLNSRIKHLIYPLNTILDESLGCAFWFAARGQGLLDNMPYQSQARVILTGSGADELFGGYTRHKNAYNRCPGTKTDKINSLRKELDFDWKRIPLRNLGRDDRVIADHGKTARSPFIEEDIVQYVRSLNPVEKCCFNSVKISGEKLLLRLCAFKLGLRASADRKKRAIQFGSRIANKNQNAKDISLSLMRSAVK